MLNYLVSRMSQIVLPYRFVIKYRNRKYMPCIVTECVCFDQVHLLHFKSLRDVRISEIEHFKMSCSFLKLKHDHITLGKYRYCIID